MNKLMPILAVSLVFSACAPETPGPADTAEDDTATTEAERVTASAELNRLVDDYFEESLELNPLGATFIGDPRYNDRLANSIGPEHRQKSFELEQRYLESVNAIDPGLLEGQDLLTREIFRLNRENAIEGAQYPAHLVPISQFFSVPNFMAVLGSGQSVQPFATVEDYDNWISRIGDFTVYVDQAIANMREGMEQGIVRPRAIMGKVLPQLSAHIVDDPTTSVFYAPVAALPETFSDADRQRLTVAMTAAITEQLVPAYKRLHDFIETEYLPATTESVGMAAITGGQEWYDYLVRTSTTTNHSADEIHEIGLAEVARIRSEMEVVKQQVGFEGTLAEYFEYLKSDDQFYFENSQGLIDGYMELKTTIDALLPQMFGVFPKTDYEVREVEAFRAASAAGASYQRGAPDGSRPGVFYVNTHNLRAQPKYGMETLSLHEASPGHHFQITIQQELEYLPRFRRFGNYTAYAEGWALYAESLGKELGLFTDPYQYYGRLSDEMLRAMRLVVDTGLHSKDWTREDVIEYMLENSSMAESDVIAEAERYIAIPGQALSYKIGQLEITRLREQAASALGDDFDIKEFHNQVLRDGALPMGVLAAKLDHWIEAEKTDNSGAGMEAR